MPPWNKGGKWAYANRQSPEVMSDPTDDNWLEGLSVIEEVPLPDALILPLDPVYSVGGNAMVYAMRKGYRVVHRNVKYKHHRPCEYRKWKRLPKVFITYDAAVKSCDAWDEFMSKQKPHFSRGKTYVRGGMDPDLAYTIGSYMEVHHKVYYTEYIRTRRADTNWPGDYHSDNMYWFFKGSNKAAASTKKSVPSGWS